MHDLPVMHLLALGVIVAMGTCVQTSIGFGAMLVSMTLGSLWLPVAELLPLLLPLAVAQTSIVALQKRDAIVWPLLLRRVLPLMSIGLLSAIVWVDTQAAWMERALGALILGLALRELLSRRPPAASGSRVVASTAGMIVAGFVQGIFATGGPVLVWALGQQSLDKGAFRASLQVVWWTMNTVLLASFVATERLDREGLTVTAMLLPAALLGIAAGHGLHDRVDETRFRTFVWSSLMVASGLLLAG